MTERTSRPTPVAATSPHAAAAVNRAAAWPRHDSGECWGDPRFRRPLRAAAAASLSKSTRGATPRR